MSRWEATLNELMKGELPMITLDNTFKNEASNINTASYDRDVVGITTTTTTPLEGTTVQKAHISVDEQGNLVAEINKDDLLIKALEDRWEKARLEKVVEKVEKEVGESVWAEPINMAIEANIEHLKEQLALAKEEIESLKRELKSEQERSDRQKEYYEGIIKDYRKIADRAEEKADAERAKYETATRIVTSIAKLLAED